MSKIKIIEKPENVPFDMIHDLLFAAHKVNRDAGINMSTAMLTGEEIENRIGKDGKCYIALENEKIVGTLSVRIVVRNTWYAKGQVPDYMLAGVLPEYQGRHINSRLAEKVFDFAREKGYPLIELDTAENNVRAIKAYKRQGFKPVSYKRPNSDHYSVVMVKWFSECPYSDLYCKFRFNLKKIFVRIRYKTGKIKHFGK